MSTSTPPSLPRFRFNLRILFVTVTAISILLWLFSQLLLYGPTQFFYLVLKTPVLALVAAMLSSMYLAGRQRAYWLGFAFGLAYGNLTAWFAELVFGADSVRMLPFYFVFPFLSAYGGLYVQQLLDSRPPPRPDEKT